MTYQGVFQAFETLISDNTGHMSATGFLPIDNGGTDGNTIDGANYGLQTLYRISVSGVDATTIQNTTLYTVPAGKNFIVVSLDVVCTAAVAVTGDATISCGTNSPSFANIIAATLQTGLGNNTKTYRNVVTAGIKTAMAGDAITARISTGATATSQTIQYNLIGYLF